MEEEIKFLIGLSLFLYASYRDLKEREIDNWVWIVMASTGAIFLIFDILNGENLAMVAISMAVSFILAFSLLVFGMGGADSKAMMALAILMPLPPSFSIIHSPIFIFPLTVLMDSLLLILPLPLLFLLYNLIRRDFEFPYALFGYRMDASKAARKHVWSMEDENGKSIVPKKDVSLSKLGNRKIWVTPKLPFIVFMAAGYITASIFGDMLTFFITLFQ